MVPVKQWGVLWRWPKMFTSMLCHETISFTSYDCRGLLGKIVELSMINNAHSANDPLRAFSIEVHKFSTRDGACLAIRNRDYPLRDDVPAEICHQVDMLMKLMLCERADMRFMHRLVFPEDAGLKSVDVIYTWLGGIDRPVVQVSLAHCDDLKRKLADVSLDRLGDLMVLASTEHFGPAFTLKFDQPFQLGVSH